eukprot:1146593-Pelagomonas_calceolata.AAC.1
MGSEGPESRCFLHKWMKSPRFQRLLLTGQDSIGEALNAGMISNLETNWTVHGRKGKLHRVCTSCVGSY